MTESKTYKVKGINVNVLEVNKGVTSGPSLVLLHGQSFEAETWRLIGTLDLLQQKGFYAAAVDLPGFGATGGHPIPTSQRGEFLHALLQQLAPHRPLVLITPSMSGTYAFPYLNAHAKELDAWINVAAVGVQDWAKIVVQGEPGSGTTAITGVMSADDPRLKIKVLAVYGEKDRRRSDFSVLEEHLPQAQFVMIPGAGHACYLDNPEVWHRELVAFLANEIL